MLRQQLWSTWDHIVSKVMSSSNLLERQHLFFGYHHQARYPIMIPRKLLFEHMWIQGPTGSGKTSRGLLPLLTQIIRRRENGLVILDLKGDMAMMMTAKTEAEQAGLAFKFFTHEIGRASYVFNPLSQINSPAVSEAEVVETLLTATGLDYGIGFGESFFSGRIRTTVIQALERCPQASTLRDLYGVMQGRDFFRSDTERDQAVAALDLFRQLAQVEAMNFTGEGKPSRIVDHGIVMKDVIEKNEVAYFWLPALGATSTVRAISNLALYALLTGSKEHLAATGLKKQSLIVIDEWQRMASPAFELVLQQARSYGVGAILSNQTLNDLKLRDTPNLLEITWNNTAIRQFFSPADPGLEELLIKQSGETAYFTNVSYEQPYSTDHGGLPFMRVGPRYTLNDLKGFSSDTKLSVLQVPRDSGFATFGGQWFVLESPFHLTEDEYNQRLSVPWPDSNMHTLTARRGGTAPSIAIPDSDQELVATETPVVAISEFGNRLEEIYARRCGGLQ